MGRRMARLTLPVLGVFLLLASVLTGQDRTAAALDEAFLAYFQSESVAARTQAGRQIVASGAPYLDVLRRVKAGRTYTPQAAGVRELPTSVGMVRLDNTLEVPVGYDPSRRYPLRVQLHGGVSRPAPGPGAPAGRGLTGNRIPSTEQLILQPRAWEGAEWWRPNQVDNILNLIARVKRTYNVDESRVYVTGISDGGTGAYYLGMRVGMMWSACMPLNGHPLVLANPDVGADGQLYMGNLVNCPMQAVNGGRDQLYPASSVEPFVAMMKKAGVDISWHVYPEAGHDTSWWPQERASFDTFVAAHPRPAYPREVSWETERTDRYNRYGWLVINALGARPSDVGLVDVNTFSPALQQQFPLYARRTPSGRVDGARNGNRFELRTRFVRELTVLLPAEEVDFTREVEVVVNGRAVFKGVVVPEASTLMTWAARDDDRGQLYAAELKIAVP